MKSLAHLYTRIVDAPLAIHPKKFDAIVGVIAKRLGLEATDEQIKAATKSPKSDSSKSYQVQDGIAIIPISGSLMKKASGLMAESGIASYETIGTQFKDAMTKSFVKGILLDIDSPGGETSGLFELADMMCSLKGDKPVYAISNDSAFSAAYALASCADKIYLTRTAGVGSIGVFCCHVDQSGADAKAGLKYTYIHAGAKKTDGNSHEPISETALADTQSEVDRQYDMFVSLVAKNRGANYDDIKETEAGVFFGENAVPLLADAVGTVEDAFSDLLNHINNSASGTTIVLGGRGADLNNHTAQKTEEINAMAKTKDIDELIALQADKEECEEPVMKDKDDKKADKPPMDDDEDEEDEDDKKDAKKAEAALASASRSDAVRIVNLCALADMPALAAEFLANDYTVAQVEKALLKHRASKSKSVKVASANTKPAADFTSVAAQINDDDSIKDKAAAFRKHLSKNPQAYLQSMLSRENGESYTFLKKRGF